jgi:hypothetical protein
MSAADRVALREACELLEHPSLAARLTAVIGRPVEEGIKLLPHPWYHRVHDAAENAIGSALDFALRSLPADDRRPSRDDLHRILGIGSGAVGGFFGLPGALFELPVATTLMLRSIADIARAEGEDFSLPEARLACVEVFAYGGRPVEDDAAETGYYGLRLAMAFHFSMVSRQLVERGLAQRALPATIGLVRAVAARFGVAVSDKLAFQLVPVAGAVGGAIVNAIFMGHFQDMARGHFTVRRLERTYGEALVRRAYERVRREQSRQVRSRRRVIRGVD